MGLVCGTDEAWVRISFVNVPCHSLCRVYAKGADRFIYLGADLSGDPVVYRFGRAIKTEKRVLNTDRKYDSHGLLLFVLCCVGSVRTLGRVRRAKTSKRQFGPFATGLTERGFRPKLVRKSPVQLSESDRETIQCEHTSQRTNER